METIDLVCIALWTVGIFLFKFSYQGNQAYKLVAEQSQDFLNSSYSMLESGEIDDSSEESKFLNAFSNSMLQSTILFFCQIALSLYILVTMPKGLIYYLAAFTLYSIIISFGLSYSYKKATGEINIFKLVRNFPKWLRSYDRISQSISGIVFIALAILVFMQ